MQVVCHCPNSAKGEKCESGGVGKKENIIETRNSFH